MFYLNPKNRDFDEPKAELQKRLNYAKYYLKYSFHNRILLYSKYVIKKVTVDV